MKKQIQFMVLGSVLLLMIAVLFVHNNKRAEAPTTVVETATESTTAVTAAEYMNATYRIDGDAVQLKDGHAETEIVPGSASIKVTRYFGNELQTDLDGDGDEDVAFVMTQETGGSGTFFYAVAALKTNNGYVGSDGYFLGDRIAPQSTTLSQNPTHKYVLVFNYAVHGLEQGLSEQPAVGKSAFLKIVPETNTWAMVEPDFEGESGE